MATFGIHGVPNTKRRGGNQKWLPRLPLLGGRKKGKLLLNRCILGGPQRQAQGGNEKWLPHPCLPRGPREGRIAT